MVPLNEIFIANKLKNADKFFFLVTLFVQNIKFVRIERLLIWLTTYFLSILRFSWVKIRFPYVKIYIYNYSKVQITKIHFSGF